MARKKRLTPEQEIQQYRECLMEEYERWGEIKMHGCNDPAWTDGQNLNLVKSHIMHHRFEIAALCMENGLPYPPEISLPIPPEAPAGYMASLDQIERVERLRAYGYGLITEWRQRDDHDRGHGRLFTASPQGTGPGHTAKMQGDRKL